MGHGILYYSLVVRCIHIDMVFGITIITIMFITWFIYIVCIFTVDAGIP